MFKLDQAIGEELLSASDRLRPLNWCLTYSNLKVWIVSLVLKPTKQKISVTANRVLLSHTGGLTGLAEEESHWGRRMAFPPLELVSPLESVGCLCNILTRSLSERRKRLPLMLPSGSKAAEIWGCNILFHRSHNYHASDGQSAQGTVAAVAGAFLQSLAQLCLHRSSLGYLRVPGVFDRAVRQQRMYVHGACTDPCAPPADWHIPATGSAPWWEADRLVWCCLQ